MNKFSFTVPEKICPSCVILKICFVISPAFKLRISVFPTKICFTPTCISPDNKEAKVDFPQPECPTIAVNFPASKLRSEEHTSELQSRQYLVCRLLLEKKKTCSPLRLLQPVGMRAFAMAHGIRLHRTLPSACLECSAAPSRTPAHNLQPVPSRP